MDREAGAPVFLTDLLERAALAHPGQPALDFLGRRWTYRQVREQAARLAGALQQLGVSRGGRVVLCLPNTPYFVMAYFAVLRVGGVVVSMNPLYAAREMEHLVADSGATTIFAPDIPEIYQKVAGLGGVRTIILCPIAEALPPLKRVAYRLFNRARIVGPRSEDPRVVRFGDLVAQGNSIEPVPLAPEDVAVLQYTGGTTGVPKGAALTHRNLVANCLQVATHDNTRPDRLETVLGVLPMFHVFALTSVLNYSIHTAGCIVLLPRFEMKSFLQAMRRTRPHRIFFVPTILAALNQPDKIRMPTAQLRLCVSGGAPLPPEVRRKFELRTGARVLEGYGLSEASPIISCNPVNGDVRDGSAGVAFPDTIIEIRSLETGALLKHGESGEVCVRGPQVMKEYWGRPEETLEVLREGTLRTGDVGYLESDGHLFLIDRIKDLILCGGYNVYPRVIEDALYEHPDVAEATVIGVPDEYRGEAPKAFVKLRDGAEISEDALRTFLAIRVSKIELPREIEFRHELPKTLIGKLSKKELRGA